MCTDHLGTPLGNAVQSCGVGLLVDIYGVVTLFALGLCIADIINVEGQRLGQVVEPVKFKLVLQFISSQYQKIPRRKGYTRYAFT